MAVHYLALLICAVFFQPTLQTTVSNATFCYDDPSCGPSSSAWPGICQTGKNQSPIDLAHNWVTTQAAIRNGAKALNFNEAYHSPNFYIRNNGHSIQVSFTENMTSTAEMSGFGFDYPYIFAQAHFHWGHDILSGGSEHTINGQHFPVEVHFVHYDSKYPNFTVASTSGDSRALSVVAVFLQPVPMREFNDNPAFRTISQNFPLTYQEKPTLVNAPLDLQLLMPQSEAYFYRYQGSLTTPGCDEKVEWTIIPDPVIISQVNYERFHLIKNEEGMKLGENYRPVQPLGKRQVQLYRKL